MDSKRKQLQMNAEHCIFLTIALRKSEKQKNIIESCNQGYNS